MSSNPGNLRLTLFYTLAAMLWVLCSDTLLANLGLPEPHVEIMQLSKGLAFILLSGALLYLILRRHDRQQRRMRSALATSEERLSLGLDAAQDGLWDWDLRSGTVYYSNGYTALLGLPPGGLGESREGWHQRLHPEDAERNARLIDSLLSSASQETSVNTFRLRHEDGSYRWFQSRGRLGLDADGKPQRFIGTVTDITQRRADEDSLRQAAAVFEATQEGVLVTDANQRIVHVNPAFSRITGYSEAEILGKHPNLLKSGRHDEAFYNRLWYALQNRGSWSGEIWNRRKNGEIYPQLQCIRAIHDSNGLVSHYVAVFSDISVLKHSQRELGYLAHHDPLTQLPNRLLFGERVRQALERAQRKRTQGAVLLIDLDHFKHINESFGHNVGDRLLKAVGDRLSGQLNEQMSMARLGGDEFALLSEDCGNAEQAAGLAHRLLGSLSAPFDLDGRELFIAASIGLYLFPGDSENVEQVLRNVDSALSKAKSSGREGFAFYALELTEYARQRVELAGALRHALEKDELRVHYQPLHDLRDGQLIGFEALVRWQHPQRGLVPPGEFIPIAEDLGLVNGIDTWVLRQACQQMVAWKAAGQAPRFVAVNVSSRQFSRGELDQQVAQVLAETGLDPASLELEVTESAVMDNPLMAQTLLERLRALGVRLAIDDFGTGYSSLARLKRLPVHKLKLDQSFVRGLPYDKDDIAITRAVIGLAQSLGLNVLAEGIERPEQAAFLLELGCDHGQGYHFGHPQPAETSPPAPQ